MKEYKLSGALSAVPDDMLLEAVEINKKSRVPSRLLRIAAACLAMLIGLVAATVGLESGEDEFVTALGLLKVYAYAETGYDTEEIFEILEGGPDEVPGYYCPASSRTPGLGFAFEMDTKAFENTDITFELSTNWGEFRRMVEGVFLTSCGNVVTIRGGEKIYWLEEGTDEELYQILEEDGNIFIDVIVKSDGHPVGYAVIEVITKESGYRYFEFTRIIREIACFPMRDGQYQNISEGEMKARMDEYRK